MGGQGLQHCQGWVAILTFMKQRLTTPFSLYQTRNPEHSRVTSSLVRFDLLLANVTNPNPSTNTHVPAPYWAAVSPVIIPLSSCNRAADVLIDWFGPEELKHVVGGERWWQVRGLDGVDGEWITEKEYLGPPKEDTNPPHELSDEDENILRMENLDTVMVSLAMTHSSLLMIFSFTFMVVGTFGAQSTLIDIRLFDTVIISI